MLQITETAAKRLKSVLATLDTRNDVCLRLGETKLGLGLVLDQQRPSDLTVEDGGETLLVIDAATARRLDGRTMDFDESSQQIAFT